MTDVAHAQESGVASAPRRPALILALLSLAAFMASLDVFIVNVAFDDIGRDFHGVSLSELSWVLNAYTILYAALLVPAGRIADRYGRKAGFLIASRSSRSPARHVLPLKVFGGWSLFAPSKRSGPRS